VICPDVKVAVPKGCEVIRVKRIDDAMQQLT
jgi:hypothetical protein